MKSVLQVADLFVFYHSCLHQELRNWFCRSLKVTTWLWKRNENIESKSNLEFKIIQIYPDETESIQLKIMMMLLEKFFKTMNKETEDLDIFSLPSFVEFLI